MTLRVDPKVAKKGLTATQKLKQLESVSFFPSFLSLLSYFFVIFCCFVGLTPKSRSWAASSLVCDFFKVPGSVGPLASHNPTLREKLEKDVVGLAHSMRSSERLHYKAQAVSNIAFKDAPPLSMFCWAEPKGGGGGKVGEGATCTEKQILARMVRWKPFLETSEMVFEVVT